MPGIDSIVDVQVSVSDINPSQEGFGVPMLLAFHSVGVGGPLVRSYTGLDGVQGDGHDQNGPVYAMAAKVFSQNPRPPRIKVGRRTVAWTHVVELVCSVATTGYVYRFNLALGQFASVVIEYVVPAASTTATVMTAIAALITARSGTGPFGAHTFAAAYAAGKITFTAGDNGYVYGFRNLPASMTFKDVSAAASVVADLSAVLAEDPAWYGLAIDQQSGPAVLAVAPVIEALRKVFVTDSADTDCADAGSTTDVMYLLRASNYFRTFVMFHKDNDARAALALMAGRFTAQPGSDTWFGKALRGVSSYLLTATQEDAIRNKNGNIYTTIATVGVTQWGWSSGGEFMDIVRGIDWLVARIKERIFRLFLVSPKVPFTDAGIATIVQEIDAQLEIAASDDVKLIVPGSYLVTAPKAADVDAGDRARRTLPGLAFSGSLQGAIHFASIRGTLIP